MGKKSATLLPNTLDILETMGEQIKLVRLRRKLSALLVAERAGIKAGSLSVSMGNYAAVLHALDHIDKDLLLVAKDDVLSKQLQDLEIATRKRAPKK